jgi:membrane protein implicated in regulation of membrane protease activity
MAESTIWWVMAGAVIAVELVTGTFYLLMLSMGFVAAAIAAHLGATLTVQLVVAAIVGGGSVVAWRRYKQTAPSALPASANHDVNMDVGATVQVEAWRPDGTSTVKYRGANWTVSLLPGTTPSPGLHSVVEVVGSQLIVKKS